MACAHPVPAGVLTVRWLSPGARTDAFFFALVLPPEITARVSVEQASTFGWSRYVGPTGESIGMHTFGASAPLKELQRKFGFTPERVLAAARAQAARARR
jgi:transketolase